MDTNLAHLQHLGVPTVTVNEYGRIVACNRHAASFLDVDGEAVVGQEWHSVVHSERTATCCVLCETRHTLRHGNEARPVSGRVRVGANVRAVTLVPIPARNHEPADIGFLILDAALAGTGTPLQITRQSTSLRGLRIDEDRFIDNLTPRERDILRCVVEGLDARGIARELGIRHSTARDYVQRILTKLGVRNKAEAVAVALTHKLLAG